MLADQEQEQRCVAESDVCNGPLKKNSDGDLSCTYHAEIF